MSGLGYVVIKFGGEFFAAYSFTACEELCKAYEGDFFQKTWIDADSPEQAAEIARDRYSDFYWEDFMAKRARPHGLRRRARDAHGIRKALL